MVSADSTPGFDSIEDTIAAFKNGQFIIVLDDPSRENEGDLIIAASLITTPQMAFMIRYSSGVICTPMLPSLTARLDLPQMTPTNTDPNRTAYTLTCDAASDLITTGISAHDRALTCRTLASPSATAADFRRPGHVLPLRARAGGVRERGGHTEAGVEFCRLAGLPEVAVISELCQDLEVVRVKGGEGDMEKEMAEIEDTGMMRRDGCLAFGKRFGLRVCTIEDLVRYVERREGKLEKTSANGA